MFSAKFCNKRCCAYADDVNKCSDECVESCDDGFNEFLKRTLNERSGQLKNFEQKYH